jgi:hypothetical protein
VGKPVMSQAIFDEVCNRLEEGRSLRSVCSDDDMPHRRDVNKWINEVAGASDQYARACEERAETLFDELVDIADNAQDAQLARLQVDTRKWYLSKVKPKKYGDRSQIDHTTDGKAFNAPTIVIQSSGEAPEKT